MQVSVLGPVEVRTSEGPVPVSGTRVRRLLVRLAVEAPRGVSNGELAEAVWFDTDPPREETNALQSLVSRLRRTLGDASLVEQTPAGYRLAGCETDVTAFEGAAKAGHAALAAGDSRLAAHELRAALASWRGEPLIDAADAPYSTGLVSRLLESRVEVRCDRIDADLMIGASAELVAELEELAAAMPLRERITGQLMRALAATGRSAEALDRYARTRELLADQLGASPSGSLHDIHLSILRGESTAGRQRPSTSLGLRVPLTSFVGRHDELKRIHELLSAGRLTTIVGPGGAGKTRLAGEAARTWSSPSPWDGDWLVELAPVTDEANLAQAFLTALGVREALRTDRPTDRPLSRDPLTRLLDSLRQQQCLLVVDNCEHLVDGIATLLARLLAECPRIRVLATSREPLGIDGEALCVVPPLGLPSAGCLAEQAPSYAAVQLFVDRAAAVQANFDVTERNVGDVVEIVRRLDGLPLAIELAAARLRVLPVGEVASRLSDRFRLLTGGSRTAVPRHRTLRAVVEWSWDLLSREERLLAERLAVFPAGVSVPGAEDVCSGDGLNTAEIADLLDSLVDKSLLQVGEDGGLRYRMLETIREYGIERLAECADVGRVRAAHARYFARLVTDAAPRLRGGDQIAALRTVEREYDNILSALRYLGDSGAAAESLGLAIELTWYWMPRNENSDAASWLAFACAVPGGASLDLHLLAETAMLLNQLTSREEQGAAEDSPPPEGSPPDADPPPAARLAAAAQQLRALPDLGERFEAARSLIQVVAAFMTQDEADLGGLLDYGLASPDPWTRAASRMFRAAVAENRGEIDKLRADATAALADFRAIGERWGMSSSLSSLGYVLTLDGDLEAAGAAYAEAAALLQELDANADGGFMRLRHAGLRVRQGRYDEARREVAEVVTSAGVQGETISAFATSLLAGIALAEGDLDTMRQLRSDALADLEQGTLAPQLGGHGRAITLSTLGLLFAEDGEPEAALGHLAAAYPVAIATHDQPVVAMVGVAVAAVASGAGRPEHAAMVLGACSVLRGGDDPTEPMQARVSRRLEAVLGERYRTCFAAGKALSHAAARAAVDPALLAAPGPEAGSTSA